MATTYLSSETDIGYGNIVEHHGRRMVVSKEPLFGFVTCIWFDKGEPMVDIFHASDLKLCESQEWKPND